MRQLCLKKRQHSGGSRRARAQMQNRRRFVLEFFFLFLEDQKAVMEDQKVLEEAAADKRPKFGNRHLTNEDDVFQFNAWDDAPLDPETLGQVVRTIEANASAKVAEEKVIFEVETK